MFQSLASFTRPDLEQLLDQLNLVFLQQLGLLLLALEGLDQARLLSVNFVKFARISVIFVSITVNTAVVSGIVVVKVPIFSAPKYYSRGSISWGFANQSSR